MKLKIIALLICICPVIVQGQSFFKAIPKPAIRSYGVANPFATPQAPTTAPGGAIIVNVFRPIANIAAYAEPGNRLMAGAGVGFQHNVWDETSGKYNCEYSISGMMWAGGSVAPKTPSEAVDFGIMAGFMNNLIMVGAIPPITSKQWQVTIGVGISLNN